MKVVPPRASKTIGSRGRGTGKNGPADALRLGCEAARLASLGWAVFPLAPGKKIPRPNTHGHKDATTDAGQIER
jgi:hypothetical protein